MAGEDKQMFKQFCEEGLPHVLEALSPPQTSGVSPNNLFMAPRDSGLGNDLDLELEEGSFEEEGNMDEDRCGALCA
ncbi:repressor of RNA polymerase III transcription MAF1 homolog [Polyodon spathula]|uniref:repressor of RNA polymerase III transcription MAF1 homolog n=1 Tax=Polyodon spathula TaxID=7913 RepID=UPI001B7DD38D|nr:repressor of RNA polymerase III transcription MAF1 homolog [Polyodon spathula]